MYQKLKADLRKIRPVLACLQHQQERLELLRELASSIPAGPVVGDRSGSRAFDTLERRIVAAEDCEMELRSYVNAHGAFLASMGRVTQSLQDPEQALLVELRYYKGYPWKRIADALCYSEQHVYRIHALALASMLPVYESERQITPDQSK